MRDIKNKLHGGTALLAALWGVSYVCFSGCRFESETTYAPRYTEQGFNSVVEGMSSNAVVTLIGLPFRTDKQTVSERWRYFNSNNAKDLDATSHLVHASISAPNSRGISIDSYGHVASQFGFDNNILGKDRGFILHIIGAPSIIESNVVSFILNYTLPKGGSGSHQVRAVWLDENGRVMTKAAFYYKDF